MEAADYLPTANRRQFVTTNAPPDSTPVWAARRAQWSILQSEIAKSNGAASIVTVESAGPDLSKNHPHRYALSKILEDHDRERYTPAQSEDRPQSERVRQSPRREPTGNDLIHRS